MSLKNWNVVASSNSSAPPMGAPESSTTLADINDILRQIMADTRQLAASDTIASAGTCDLGSKDATILTVSGTTTITGLGTVSAGIYKFAVFSGVLTLTHNGTSLILPGGANITSGAGDSALFVSLGSGNWKCMFYQVAAASSSYQPLDATLTALAGLATGANKIPYSTGSDAFSQLDLSTNTALGSSDTTLSSQKAVKTYVDGQVSTINSNLSAKAAIDSQTFTGTPSLPTGTTATTQTLSDSSTKLATTAFVQGNKGSFTQSSVITASGTAPEITGIPSTAKMIVINFTGISTNSTTAIRVNLGDSGGYYTSGYGASGFATVTGTNTTLLESYTAGIPIAVTNVVASQSFKGSITLTLMDATNKIWSIMGVVSSTLGVSTIYSALTTTNDLSKIRFYAGGSDTFDAGTFSVLYQ